MINMIKERKSINQSARSAGRTNSLNQSDHYTLIILGNTVHCPETSGFNPFSAGIDFRRQHMTSKVDPRTVRNKIFIMIADP